MADWIREIGLEVMEKVLKDIEDGIYENFEVIGGNSFNPQINPNIVLPRRHPDGLYVLHTKTREELYLERIGVK